MRKESTTKKNISPKIVCNSPWRLTRVKPLANYILEVEFIDGTCGYVDMKELVTSRHAGVFSTLKNMGVFSQVYLEYGAATWPGEIDLAPDAMHDEIKKKGHWIMH